MELSPNCNKRPELTVGVGRWEIATGAIRAGLVVCPCTMLAVAHDIKYRAQASNASIFVGDTASVKSFLEVRDDCQKVRIVLQAAGPAVDGVQQLPEVLAAHTRADTIFDLQPPTKSSEPSMIFFTSGTTGMPKMVLHSQVSYPLGRPPSCVPFLSYLP